ncbi:MAG: hypothetical protein HY094_07320 [Candidatus Melainabacteria bacterium]|nr:hypothetical protein [Candidatus Melainabacteria bacterium]
MKLKKQKLKAKHENPRKDSFSNPGKKELAQLKAAYKKGHLKFNSKKIAEAIWKDKNIKKGLTK